MKYTPIFSKYSITSSRRNHIHIKLFTGLVGILFLVLGSACERGIDGRDGRAYLSVNWTNDKPTLIDPGTSAIPHVFEYGRYYQAWPGHNYLYYEGRIWNGMGYSKYAWEMEYEIYELKGESGGYQYNGADAPDTYFDLECSPFGPAWFADEVYKSMSNQGWQQLESGSWQKEQKGFGLRIKYRAVSTDAPLVKK